LKHRLLSLVIALAGPALSGVLLVLSFPGYGQVWMIWFAIVPLMVTIYGRHPAHGFLLSHLTGAIFFAGMCGWILESPGYTLFHHFFAVVFIGAPFGLFGVVFSFLSRRAVGASALIAAPCMWICIEYLRCNFSFLSLPWGLLAHSQYQQSLLIQISDIAGAYGLSFIIALVNTALAAVVMQSLPRLNIQKNTGFTPPSGRSVASMIIFSLILVGLALFYGRLALAKPVIGKSVRVAVVQGNIDQKMKWNPRYAKSIIKTYTSLTREAAKSRPDLIVWPEAATPGPIFTNNRLYHWVRRIAEASGTYLLVGSSSREKFKTDAGKRRRAELRNSAFLINPKKEAESQRYDKILLVPFGEYIPRKETFLWSWIKVPELAQYRPGEKFTVFEGPHFRFSAVICWESIFPNLVRQFRKEGAQFIVNMTNESWYQQTSALNQFVSMSVFRAVENRIYVVRCANTGISCFIDPYGTIIDRVKDHTGRDIFVRGVLTKTIILMDAMTFYSMYGDWLVWLSIICLAVVLVMAFFRKNPGKHFR